MEYNNLLQLNVSVKAHEIMSFTPIIKDLRAKLVIQLNDCNEKELQSVSEFVFSPVADFEFWVDLNLNLAQKDIKDAWLNNLANLLCHLNYVIIANKKIIGYRSTTTNNNSIAYIRRFLETQGFDNVLFVPLKNESVISDIPFIVFEPGNIPGGETIKDHLIEKVRSASYPLQLYFYVTDKNGEPEKIKAFTNKLYSKLKAETDTTLLLKIRELREEIDKAAINNKELHSTILVKETYIDFLKNMVYGNQEEEGAGNYNYSEMIKIKKFYHFEYEILPLWYKRFGHILKVLMGKRTFKSLFNDNVKKYIDSK